jgi:hypothetical protein
LGPRKTIASAASRVSLAALLVGAGLTAAAAADEDNAAVRAKIVAQARTALAQVELFLKIPADDEAIGPGGAGETVAGQLQDRQQEQIAREKKAIDLMGVVIAPRELLVPDTGIDPRRVDRWEVIDSGGRRTLARRSAILIDAPALVLEPVDAQASWPVPQFLDAAIDASASLLLVTPQRVQLEWVLNTAVSRPATSWQPGQDADEHRVPFWVVGSLSAVGVSADALFGAAPRAAAANLIFDATGQLTGIGLADRVSVRDAMPPWRAADLRGARRINEADWQQIHERTRDGFSPVLYPVRIEYRRPKGGAQAFPDSELLGWALSDRSLILPHGMHRTIAAQIHRITVQTGGREVEARLAGHLKDLDAFLIALANGSEPLPAHSDVRKTGRVEPYRPHLAMTLSRKYGANDLRIDYTRMLGSTQGYGNRAQPQLSPAPSLGSLVLDLDSNPIGLFARRRRPMEELEPYERSQLNPLRLPQQTGSAELFRLADWASALNDPASFDPHVVWREEKEQDRRVWLGIEFSPLTRELAESLGCRKESKDGSVGLRINEVYAGSPAERIGLRAGDVLLAVEVPDRPRPIDLVPPRGGRGTPDPSQFQSGENPFAAQGQARAPWPSRNNYLTNLLAILGTDARVKLRFWRDGQRQEVEATVAQAPPDQDSVEQFKDEKLGVTVKGITYEVRTALKLKPDDPGVVVAKVESGSPAARARINQFEIVQSADGVPLDSPARFEEVVKSAQQAKKDQLRLVIVDRGRQRFADLKLGQ